MLVGQAGSMVLQAGCFILLARLLGVLEYGVFAGAFALVNIVTPYSALGSSMLFMRYVIADRSRAADYWGNSLLLASAMTVVIAGVVVFLGPAVTNVHSRMIFLLLVLANCLLSQIATLASSVFVTFEKMRFTAMLNLLSNLARFAVLLFMQATIHQATAIQWSIGVVAASAFAALMSLICVWREIGPVSCDFKLMRERALEGLGFSFAGTTQGLYNDLDKTMMSHYHLNKENGFYTLAYRIIDLATAPIVALDAAIMPRFFNASQQGIRHVIRLAIKSVRTSLLLGFAVALICLSFAPIVPRIVGRDFSGVISALHWLCWIPLLRGVHRMTGGALTGLGYQHRRTVAQLIVAALNFVLNLCWIPAYGWLGAAWSSLASDGLLAVFNALILFYIWRSVSQQDVAANRRLGGIIGGE
jgi:O-antigen/teichoic acid export membrane protein